MNDDIIFDLQDIARKISTDAWAQAMGQWHNRDGYIEVIEKALWEFLEKYKELKKL